MWACVSEKSTSKQINKNTIMIQVKLFRESEPLGKSLFEEQINQFLQENATTIKVIDIKYAMASPHLSDAFWTAMVIYETL
jgi:hypothetical protein